MRLDTRDDGNGVSPENNKETMNLEHLKTYLPTEHFLERARSAVAVCGGKGA